MLHIFHYYDARYHYADSLSQYSPALCARHLRKYVKTVRNPVTKSNYSNTLGPPTWCSFFQCNAGIFNYATVVSWLNDWKLYRAIFAGCIYLTAPFESHLLFPHLLPQWSRALVNPYSLSFSLIQTALLGTSWNNIYRIFFQRSFLSNNFLTKQTYV